MLWFVVELRFSGMSSVVVVGTATRRDRGEGIAVGDMACAGGERLLLVVRGFRSV
jgi:hypothetical protein